MTRPPTRKVERKQCYVITYAQNATPAAVPFLNSLQVYCEANNAELLVIPGYYRNPTSIWTEEDAEWASELSPYLHGDRYDICEHLVVYGNTSIQPTSVRPLTGLTYGKPSGIYGHPRRHWLTVASNQRLYPRLFVTTGAVTYPNYTWSKSGHKAAEFHALGACIVKLDGPLFHLRHITANQDGSFTDGAAMYSPDGRFRRAPRPAGLVLGDLHVAKLGNSVEDRVLALVDRIDPETLVLHDVLDFESRSHHIRDQFWERYRRVHKNGYESVYQELVDTCRFLRQLSTNRKVVVSRSNHDEMLDKWMLAVDPKQDPTNSEFFHEFWYLWHNTMGETPVFPLVYQELYSRDKKAQPVFLERDNSCMIRGVECGFHGDIGPNGSRGTINSYAKLGIPMVIAHSHTPGIVDWVHQVGHTGPPDHGYNRLPSSWLETHEIIYDDGQRTLFNVIEGRDGF